MHGGRSSRLLAIGLQWNLRLLEVEAERSSSSFCSTSSVSLSSVWECPAGDLLQTVREQDQSKYHHYCCCCGDQRTLHFDPSLLYHRFLDVCHLQSVQLLSFAASQCWLMLNGEWLLQLQWQQVEEELQMVSSTCRCCRLQLSDGAGEPPGVYHVLCAGTLFALHTNGLICILMMCLQLKPQLSLTFLLLKHFKHTKSNLQLATSASEAVQTT